MTKLSDGQLVVLSAATQREDGIVFPITQKMKGNAVGNILKSLLARGYLEEIPGRADDRMWRFADDGSPLTLRATSLARTELGIEPVTTPDAAPDEVARETAMPSATDGTDKSTEEPDSPALPTIKLRVGTKQATLISMLKSPEGATIAEIAAITSWMPHTVRGALAGALKKKLGLDVTSAKEGERGRLYRIVD